ncbi:SAM-dependent methyltransferase [Salmonella enterica subsp. salamae]|nr:SAM-dependent methyltransferase [Salmonella enterica subsp. salamae]
MDLSADIFATHRIRLLPDIGKIPWDEEAQTSSTQFRAVGKTFAGKLLAEKATTSEGIPLSKRNKPMDIPRIFTISESEHRIHNPFTAEKYATLGHALRMKPGTRILDLGSGSGEMLCTWARDYGVTGTGVDISPLFTTQAKQRAEELGVSEYVHFIHNDAAGYIGEEKYDVAACVGATWIAGGVAGQ